MNRGLRRELKIIEDVNENKFYTEEGLKEHLLNEFFNDFDPNEIYERDAVEFHAMSNEHTEILGQFLDHTSMNVEELKDCLIKGYISRISN